MYNLYTYFESTTNNCGYQMQNREQTAHRPLNLSTISVDLRQIFSERMQSVNYVVKLLRLSCREYIGPRSFYTFNFRSNSFNSITNRINQKFPSRWSVHLLLKFTVRFVNLFKSCSHLLGIFDLLFLALNARGFFFDKSFLSVSSLFDCFFV